MPTPNPFDDAAKPLLEAEAGLTNDERSDIWEAYHLLHHFTSGGMSRDQDMPGIGV
jgi:hypothetical protein